MKSTYKQQIIIVGAGPAGLMAAFSAAQAGASVLILEKMKRPGLKLLASGGGRCNLTNVLPQQEFMKAFGRNGRFMRDALNSFSRDDLLEWMRAQKVDVDCVDGFYYFPAAARSSVVLEAMVQVCQENGVKFRLGEKVEKLVATKEAIQGVQVAGGKVIYGKAVILACGGKSYSKLGGSSIGYQLAEQAGHKIIMPVPGMVGLKTIERWPSCCTGISLDKVRISIDIKKYRKQYFEGALVFTQDGISGPAVVDISANVNELLLEEESVPVNVSFFPEKKEDEISGMLKKLLEENPRKKLSNIISLIFPAALAAALCDYAGDLAGVTGAGGIKAAGLPGKVFKSLNNILLSCPLWVNANQGFEKAMVTRGGADLKGIYPKTMESRLKQHLYFAGEVVNLDGPCGGYNLQWAFSSGYLAGQSAALEASQ
ncbi:MAG: aminoacetone oxidase family FAD-binding enzyme [Lentisphaerae bacterium]|nr:aminoacetone oxidase family FAD-binding enzyme [Lentisphaerota bacterium]MCP4101256.1 aminoacetone oxidase family FAD-binding enzyme [Lentisphaerota bacterium]